MLVLVSPLLSLTTLVLVELLRSGSMIHSLSFPSRLKIMSYSISVNMIPKQVRLLSSLKLLLKVVMSLLPKYNNPISNSGCRKRRIWAPHFIESKLGLAEYEIDLSLDGEIDIFDAIQELSEFVDIDNIVKRYNNGELDVLEKVQGFYGDLTTLPVDMRGIYDLNAQGKSLFDSLPEDVRDKIGDYKSFMTMAAEKYDDIFKSKESEVIDNASEE